MISLKKVLPDRIVIPELSTLQVWHLILHPENKKVLSNYFSNNKAFL